MLNLKVHLICNDSRYTTLTDLTLPIYLRSSVLQNRIFEYLQKLPFVQRHSQSHAQPQSPSQSQSLLSLAEALRSLKVRIDIRRAPRRREAHIHITTDRECAELLPSAEWYPWPPPAQTKKEHASSKTKLIGGVALGGGVFIALSTVTLLRWLKRKSFVLDAAMKLWESGQVIALPYDYFACSLRFPDFPFEPGFVSVNLLFSGSEVWLQTCNEGDQPFTPAILEDANFQSFMSNLASKFSASAIIVKCSAPGTCSVQCFGPTDDNRYVWMKPNACLDSKSARRLLLTGIAPVELHFSHDYKLLSEDLKIGMDRQGRAAHQIDNPHEVAERLGKAQTSDILIGAHLYSFNLVDADIGPMLCVKTSGRPTCFGFEVRDPGGDEYARWALILNPSNMTLPLTTLLQVARDLQSLFNARLMCLVGDFGAEAEAKAQAMNMGYREGSYSEMACLWKVRGRARVSEPEPQWTEMRVLDLGPQQS